MILVQMGSKRGAPPRSVVDRAPEAFREAFCAHHLLFTFGLSPDDVYVVRSAICSRSSDPSMVVVARRGSLRMVIEVGRSGYEDRSDEEFLSAWMLFVKACNEMSLDDRRAVSDRTSIRARAAEIFAELISRDFGVVLSKRVLH